MIKSYWLFTGALISMFIFGCRTEHEIRTTHEIKPIHITIDINIKVDKALDDVFKDLDEESNNTKVQ